MPECSHGITLERVVETCAECKEVVSTRVSEEAQLRLALRRIMMEVDAAKPGSNIESIVWNIARTTLGWEPVVVCENCGVPYEEGVTHYPMNLGVCALSATV